MKDLKTMFEDLCKDELLIEKKNSTRSPVGMRLLFLFDTIISCFLKNNTIEDVVTKK